MIRRELPRTENADWVMRPYRTKGGRILLSVNPGRVTRTVPSEPDVFVPEQSLPFPPSRRRCLASPPGPVQAERSEPEGSLDG